MSQTLTKAGGGSLVCEICAQRPQRPGPNARETVLSMKRLWFGCLIAGVAWLFSDPASAYRGIELGRDCRSMEDVAQARCEGFVSGFLAGAQLDVDGEPITMWRSHGYTWCGPALIDVAAIVETLFEGARTGRSSPHFPASVMLAQSLSAAYPCNQTPVGRPSRLAPPPVDRTQ